ncbi:hypothetical protein, partial [Providencia alcalifaciens]|uniref:hypothetical protein n=1 Tax=Providencia alcalifaciens TaxID=126385 RepID=UPI001E2FB45F
RPNPIKIGIHYSQLHLPHFGQLILNPVKKPDRKSCLENELTPDCSSFALPIFPAINPIIFDPDIFSPHSLHLKSIIISCN